MGFSISPSADDQERTTLIIRLFPGSLKVHHASGEILLFAYIPRQLLLEQWRLKRSL